MLLVPSITFHCHCYIYVCMCSTDPFQFRWLKGYTYSTCYYHNQIGSINLTHCCHIFRGCAPEMRLRCLLHNILSFIAYTFRENRDLVFITIAQFTMSADSRIPFGLQIIFVCLYITSSHYRHCANLSEDIKLIKMPLRYILSSVWVWLSIFSVIRYTIHVFSVYLFPMWWYIYIYIYTHIYIYIYIYTCTLSYYHHQIGSMNYYP